MRPECDVLIQYIDDVLYHPKRAYLDISALPEDCQVLGESIVKLAESVLEANEHAEALTRRDWKEASATSTDNVFAHNIEKIRLMLEDMTDQIQEIVGISQTEVSQEAPASASFENAVAELRRRTSALENERNLFVQFTESASERIIVLDEETGDMLFGNKVARDFHEQNHTYIDDAHTMNQESGCTSANPYSEWLHTVYRPGEDGTMITEYYEVHSLYIIWEHRGAIAHMFSDVTELQKFQDLATKDALTGLYNRAFAIRYLDDAWMRDANLLVAFVDVDYLKYCNDSLGHSQGDEYLSEIAALLQNLACEKVVCRTGGDEFLVITETTDSDVLRTLLEQARAQLGTNKFEGDEEAPKKSFSFGIASRTEEAAGDVSRVLALADERMYIDKLENKRKNHLAFEDDRL